MSRSFSSVPGCTPPAVEDPGLLFRAAGLIKNRGAGFVLRVPELTLRRGEALGLAGPNGCGKSTLLRLLALLEEPDTGQIVYLGTSRKGERPPRHRVALLPQTPCLLKRSVFENVAYGLRVRGDRVRLPERVHGALAAVGLDPGAFAHRRWYQLSGGEAQRVALASRLVLRPEALLLDEPTAGVDRRSAELIRQAVAAVRSEHRTCLVVASHDIHWLRGVCDRVLRMHDGSITGREIDNLIEGPWEEDADGLWSRPLSDGRRIKALPPPQPGVPAVLSPAHIIVSIERPSHLSDRNVLRGTLVRTWAEEHVDGRCHRVLLEVRVADLPLVCRVTREAVADLRLVPGSDLWVVFKASSLQWAG
ncbi:MAG: ATP-binding cassette domain-containing protein [Spirochaetota bacterium]